MRDRVAFVTGAASGIGRATALLLARQGVHVVAVDVVADELDAVVAGAAGAAGDVIACVADVSDDAQVRAAVDLADQRYGRLDAVFNNAGIDLPTATRITETSDEDWARIIGVNLTGVFQVARATMPLLVASGRGAMVNTSSVAGLIASPAEAAYGASKGGVLALTRQMAGDYAPEVRVNALCPGMVERPMRDRRAALGAAALDKREQVAKARPMRRYGTYEEMARGALFLLSDDSSFMTGSTLVFDGGWTAV